MKDIAEPMNPNRSELADPNNKKVIKTDSPKGVFKENSIVGKREKLEIFKYIFIVKENHVEKNRPKKDLRRSLNKKNHSIPWTISTLKGFLSGNEERVVNQVPFGTINEKISTGNLSRDQNLSSIEFLWPVDLGERKIIIDLLVNCLGVINGIMTSQNKIYLMGTASGKYHQITPLQSRHIRVKDYNPLRSEKLMIEKIKSLHRLSSGRLVHIFPKKLDDFIFQNIFSRPNSLAGLKKEIWQYHLIGKSSIFLVSISSNGAVDKFQLPYENRECSTEN